MKNKMAMKVFTVLLSLGMLFGVREIYTNTQELQAQETRLNNTLVPNALIPADQLKLPETVNVPEDLQLPEPIDSLATYALNGSKLESMSTIMNPVIFVEFADDTGEWLTSANLERMDQLYNIGENCLADYFYDVSFNNLIVQSEFFPKKENANGTMSVNTVVPFKSSKARGYIMPKSASNPIGYDPAAGEDVTNPDSARFHESMIIKEAIGSIGDKENNIAKQIYTLAGHYGWNFDTNYTASGFDWDFPQAEQIKFWESISLDSCTFVFRGVAENSQDNSILWPHKFIYPTGKGDFGIPLFDYVDKDNYTTLFNYVVVPADNDFSKPDAHNLFKPDDSSIGVVVHEFFHQFGSPDLYRTSYKGMAVGEWDLMGSQNGVPQYLLQYTNAKFGIWNTPDFKEINASQTLANRTDVSVNLAKYDGSDTNLAYVIKPKNAVGANAHEYFMVEYRKKQDAGFDSEIWGSGLVVYRIKDDIPSTNIDNAYCGISCGNALTGLPGELTADEVFVFRPGAANVHLFDQSAWDRVGIPNAAFPRTIEGTSVNKIGKSLTDVPASTRPVDFDNETLYFSDGSNSGIRIENISDAGGDSMSFSVLYDNETLSVTEDKGVTSLRVTTPSQTLRVGDSPSANTLTAVDGKTPLTFRITAIQKDDMAVADSGLFEISDTDTTDALASLSVGSGKTLSKGTYIVSVSVSDTIATKSVNVTYIVKAAIPTDTTLLTYNANALHTDSDFNTAVLGTLSLEGASDDGWVSDLGIDSMRYSIGFLPGKDYSEYFDMFPILGTSSGQLKAKKAIPEGEYEFKGIITFKESGKSDVTLVNDTFKVTIQKAPSDGDVRDTTAPIIIDGNITKTPSTWTKDEVVVAIPISDDSGLKDVTITTTTGSIDDNGTAQTSVTKSIAGTAILQATPSFTLTQNGSYSVVVKDQANNTSIATLITIDNIDTSKPQIDPSNKLTSPTTWSKDALSIAIPISDVGAGIHEITIVTLDGEIDNQGTKVKTLTRTINDDKVLSDTWNVVICKNGSYQITANDFAGNEAVMKPFVVSKLDNEKPIIDAVEVSPSNALLIFPTNTNRLAITAHDMPNSANSGIAYYKYQLVAVGDDAPSEALNDPAWIQLAYENSIEVAGSFEGTLYVYAFDQAGNCSDVFSEELEPYVPGEPILSKDATLKSLSIGYSLSSAFDPATYTYTASVEYEIASLSISALANDSKALVSGDVGTMKDLAVGENRFVVNVVAEDTSVTKTYTIVITRKAQPLNPTPPEKNSDSTLANLQLSAGSLTPSFGKNTLHYSASVTYDIDSLKLHALASDSKAVISGDVDRDVVLKEGVTTLTIKVTAENGASSFYVIQVTRESKPKEPDPNPENPIVPNQIEIENSDGSISVFGSFDDTFKVVSEAIQNSTIEQAMQANPEYTFENTFDIYITKNGEKYTIDEAVTVRIQLSEKQKGRSNLYVIYIEEDGNIINMPTKVYGDYLEFSTDHFSTYAIVSPTTNLVDGANTGVYEEMLVWVLLFIGLGSSVSLLVRNSKKVNNQD